MTTTAGAPFRASRYTTGAVLLHWLIALLIVLQLVSGVAMNDYVPRGSALQYDIFQLHKSMGVTVLVLTLARILWRLFNPPPPEPASVGRWEGRLAGLVQFLFYALLLVIPLTGWLVISAATVRVDTVLFFVPWLPFPDLPFVADLGNGTRHLLEVAGGEVHELLAWAMVGLLALHVAGALKHHLADGVFLKRMSLGGPARRTHGAAVAVIAPLLVLAGLIGAATLARNEIPATTASAGTASEQAASAPAEGAEAWVLQPDGSALTYRVRYARAELEGAFSRFDAAIVFAPDDLANASIDVTIDTSSATIESTEISLQNLAGSDGFDNKAFGTARFRSQSIRREGDGYVAEGTLTIRGEDHPQTLAFNVTIDGDTATANGTMTVARLDYGIGRKSDAKGDYLGLDVTLAVAITARRAD